MSTTKLTCLVFLVSYPCYPHCNAQDTSTQCLDKYSLSPMDNTCFRVSNEKVSMSKAKAICMDENGGRLMEIKDSTTLATVLAMTKNKRYWVGIEKKADGNFQYINGGQLEDFLEWQPGQPSPRNESQDCVEMNAQGQLNDESCHLKRRYICQTDLEEEENIPTTTETPSHVTLPGPLSVGYWIKLKAVMPPTTGRCYVSLLTDTGDTAFHLSPRSVGSTKWTVLNTKIGGRWGKEMVDRSFFPFDGVSLLEVDIVVKQECFKIYINGQPLWEFKHRLPVENKVTKLHLFGDCHYRKPEFHKDPYQERMA